jgi:hypothetical protein
MALADYSDLISALDGWLDHALFSARYADFVGLFEATANRRLRVRQMEAVVSLVPDGSGNAALPSDYLAWRRLTWTGQTRTELAFVHPSYLQAAYPSSPADVPRIFTIEGSTLRVRPLDSTPLDFDYYRQIPSLSANGTNWLMSAHPDIYLFGVMAEAEAFGVNDERMPLWKTRRDEIFDQIIKLNNQTRGTSAVRAFGVTP